MITTRVALPPMLARMSTVPVCEWAGTCTEPATTLVAEVSSLENYAQAYRRARGEVTDDEVASALGRRLFGYRASNSWRRLCDEHLASERTYLEDGAVGMLVERKLAKR